MKKLSILFFALTFVLTSCSNDDNSSTEDILILPKTISYSYPNSPAENYKTIMTYEGNKIKSIDRGNYIVKFIYEGNIIVKQLRFDVDSNGNESKVRETVYTYSNGKVINKTSRVTFSESQPNGADYLITDYTHNSDGTISYIQYLPNSTDVDYTAILSYKNKNLIKRELIYDDPTYGKETDVYEYDSKNNPLKNILGFDLLIEEISGYGTNNNIKLTRTTTEIPSRTIYKANYFYNENDYPVKNNSVTNIIGAGEDLKDLEYSY